MVAEDKSKPKNRVPEFDEELSYLFFASKADLSEEDQREEEDLRKLFFSTYRIFFENRQNLIDKLRNIADESVAIKKNCNISSVTCGSVGIAGGAAALVGTVVFPPLFLGGLAVAGLATVSNIGTRITEFVIFRTLLKKAVQLSKYDTELAENLEEIYQKILLSNLFIIDERVKSSSEEVNLKKVADGHPSLGLLLSSGGAKGAAALGLRSASIEMIEFSGRLMRSFARSAVGIGIVIDGVTIALSSVDLAKGSNSKFSEALRNFADEKEKELLRVKKIVEGSELIGESVA